MNTRRRAACQVLQYTSVLRLQRSYSFALWRLRVTLRVVGGQRSISAAEADRGEGGSQLVGTAASTWWVRSVHTLWVVKATGFRVRV